MSSILRNLLTFLSFFYNNDLKLIKKRDHFIIPEIKEKLKKLTNDAFKKNIFGAPTYVVNNKNFWGQDRLEFAIEELKFIS